MNKKALILLATSVAAAGLSSCGSSISGITITVWDDQSNIETIRTLCDEFITERSSRYPNAPALTIDIESHAEASAVSDLINTASAGEGPDIFSMTSDTLPTAAKAKIIAPASHADDIKANFTDDAITNVTYDSTIYGYPVTAESQVVLYDKREITANELVSFDNLLASGKKIAWDTNGDDCAYYMFGFCNDSVLFGDDGTDATKLNLDTDQSVANIVSLINTYNSTIVALNPNQATANFGDSAAAATRVVGVVTSPFLLPSIQEILGEANVGIATLPSINDENLRPFSGYKVYGVNSYNKNGEIAQELADYLVSSDSQAWRLTKKHYLPTRYDGEINEILATDAYVPTYKASLDNSFAMPIIDKMAYYWSPMISFCQKQWDARGNVTAASVKADLATVESEISK